MERDTLEPLTRATQAMGKHRTPSDVLQEIVEQAARCLPEFEHVSVSRIREDRHLETLAVTTDLARQFDRVQSEARGGPCVEAGKLDEVVLVDDARHEQRWPAYIKGALPLGLRSQLGIMLFSDSRGAICLNLHSTTTDQIDGGSVGVAEHFAVQAGAALGHVESADQLKTAIGTRTVIGTAIGLLMERHDMGQEAAFNYLLRESSTSNRKIRLVAQELVQDKENAVAGERDGGR
jgi:GAF domain-containing protein